MNLDGEMLRERLISTLNADDSGSLIEGENVLRRPDLLLSSLALAKQLEKSGRMGPVLIVGARGLRLLSYVTACILSKRTFSIADPGVPETRLEVVKHLLSCETIVDLRGDFEQIYDLSTSTATKSHRKVQGATYVVFTSGSTGIPKGVVVGPESYIPFVDWFLRELSLSPTETFSSVNPAHFDNFIADMTVALWSKSSVRFLPDPTTELALFKKELGNGDLTHWFSVPSLIKFLDSLNVLDKQNMRKLRWLGFGGEAFFLQDIRRIAKKLPESCRLVNVYGPSETTCISSMSEVGDDDLNSDSDYPSIGLMNDNFDSWLDAKSGELVLSGVQVARGYLGSESRSFESQGSTRIYRTGDIMSLESSGYRFLSRKDRQVKVMGHRIELNEVEAVCQSVDGVDDVMAVVCTQFGQQVLGVVFRGELDEGLLSKEVAKNAPKYLVPRIVIRVKSMPTNRNGKRDYLKAKQMLDALYD